MNDEIACQNLQTGIGDGRFMYCDTLKKIYAERYNYPFTMIFISVLYATNV